MSLWRRIFRRDTPPPPPTPEEPKLNEDWAPGDQALCIADFSGFRFLKWPIVDEVYIVADVQPLDEVVLRNGMPVTSGRKAFGLSLRGLQPHVHWHCNGFRKIIPQKDGETTDIGVSELIKRCAPAPEKVG